jgi:hypothetical protein
VLDDADGDGLAADQPGLDQLVGIRAVQLRAGRADRGAAVPARDVDHPVGQVERRRDREHAGDRVEVVQQAAQPNRLTAAADGGDVGQPPRIVRAGGAVKGAP